MPKISLVIAAIAMLSAAYFAHADDAELENVRQKVGEMFDLIDPEDVSASPVEGWYTIHKGSIVVYISADGRYLLQGDLIDLDLQENLSENVRNDSRRDLMAGVSDEQAIVFSPEEVKFSVDIFTDVDCTYCRRLHAQIDQYLAHGIEVRYLMYPRNGPASPAWTTAEQVWCASDRQNALTLAKLGEAFPTNECDASMVQNHYIIGRDAGLSGTPAIVLDDGTLIGGYITPDQLHGMLQQKFQ
ncbi:MAG: thioredoxin fold domain-containing protein [Woeseiaceae bacterium]|nr:thioredoxin fold domain-containing protein [Woeseiaceae bacterium]